MNTEQDKTCEQIYVEELMDKNRLRSYFMCEACHIPYQLKKYHRNSDKCAWRCMHYSCKNYKKYFSVRKGSFYESFTGTLKEIDTIIDFYSEGASYTTINKISQLSSRTIFEILEDLRIKIPEPNFEYNKLGGNGLVVQIDEMMLNFKCKNHRGRSTSNKTYSLVNVETCNTIGTQRVFAKIIPNKKIPLLFL